METKDYDEKQLDPEEQEKLIATLKKRFEENDRYHLHDSIRWEDVERALDANPDKLWSIQQLEITGGQPDVISEEKGEFIFGDCSVEPPAGRTHVVFDRKGYNHLVEKHSLFMPNGIAEEMAAEFGVDFMSEEQYRDLEKKITLDKMGWSMLENGRVGRRVGGNLQVWSGFPEDFDEGVSFRAVVRVPKA